MSTHHHVHRVTDAPTTQADDMKPRMLKYGISMGFRIVFFPIAVFLFDGWVRIAALILVLVLPWIAVVIANAGRETTPHSEDLIGQPEPYELGDQKRSGDQTQDDGQSGRAGWSTRSPRTGSIPGEVVDEPHPAKGARNDGNART